MKQQQCEARVSREASETVQVHIGVNGKWKRSSSATTIICHKEASLNNSSGEIIQRRGNRNGESSSGESMKTCKARM